MVEKRKSIQQIGKVIPTNGSQPVEVLCDDLKDYICKYAEQIPASKLFNEFLCASFAEIWSLPLPYFAFVSIKPEHVPDAILSGRIRRSYFQTTCFGSQRIEDAIDVVNALTAFSKQDQLMMKKQDLLKIALFDL